MRRKPKIVIICVGSAIFGLSMLKDAFSTTDLWGSEMVLVDIDQNTFEKMAAAARRINDQLAMVFMVMF